VSLADLRRRIVDRIEYRISEYNRERREAYETAVAIVVEEFERTPVAPAWGPLPTADEVTAHVARRAPARGSDGAPWAFRCVDSSGDYVAIVYLRAQGDVVMQREPGRIVWFLPRAWHRDAQWRPVDGEGMPVGRVT